MDIGPNGVMSIANNTYTTGVIDITSWPTGSVSH